MFPKMWFSVREVTEKAAFILVNLDESKLAELKCFPFGIHVRYTLPKQRSTDRTAKITFQAFWGAIPHPSSKLPPGG